MHRSTPAFAIACFGDAVAIIGGVPQSILYDNLRIAVTKILGGGKRGPKATPAGR
jgi:hypothetical protein